VLRLIPLRRTLLTLLDICQAVQGMFLQGRADCCSILVH